jgi:hypothetical protein
MRPSLIVPKTQADTRRISGQASGTFVQEIEGMGYGFVLTIWTGSLVTSVGNYRFWHDSERVARCFHHDFR